MPEKIKLADGSEREVPTADEQKVFEENAKKLDGLKDTQKFIDDLKKDLEIKEGESLGDRIKDLKDNQNPNWGKARKKIATLEKVLKDQGKKMDDDGNVVEDKEPITKEEIEQTALNTYKKEEASKKQTALLQKIEKEEDRESVKKEMDSYLKKGLELDESFKLAHEKVLPDYSPDDVTKNFNNTGGDPPKINLGNKKDEDFSQTEQGKIMSERLSLNFAKKEKEAEVAANKGDGK